MSRLPLLVSLFYAASLLAYSPARTEDRVSLERGAYLVNGIAACASCHTPEADGKLGPSLSGGKRLGGGDNAVLSPNITADQETGIGAWSDAQIIDAIRNGRRPDGTAITAPMPQTFQFMSDNDAKSIVLYIRSLPAIPHKVAARAASLKDSAKDVRTVASPDTADPVKRGEYIADALAHCSSCHTSVSASSPEFPKRKNQGGRIFKVAGGTLAAPGIRKSDLAAYSDTELADIITKGVRPDGHKITGPMPIAAYAKMSAQDLSDIIRFLRND